MTSTFPPSQFPGGDKLAPPISSPDYAHYKMWMHYSEGTAACRIGAKRHGS